MPNHAERPPGPEDSVSELIGLFHADRQELASAQDMDLLRLHAELLEAKAEFARPELRVDVAGHTEIAPGKTERNADEWTAGERGGSVVDGTGPMDQVSARLIKPLIDERLDRLPAEMDDRQAAEAVRAIAEEADELLRRQTALTGERHQAYAVFSSTYVTPEGARKVAVLGAGRVDAFIEKKSGRVRNVLKGVRKKTQALGGKRVTLDVGTFDLPEGRGVVLMSNGAEKMGIGKKAVRAALAKTETAADACTQLITRSRRAAAKRSGRQRKAFDSITVLAAR